MFANVSLVHWTSVYALPSSTVPSSGFPYSDLQHYFPPDPLVRSNIFLSQSTHPQPLFVARHLAPTLPPPLTINSCSIRRVFVHCPALALPLTSTSSRSTSTRALPPSALHSTKTCHDPVKLEGVTCPLSVTIFYPSRYPVPSG
jgi:hypothetical protein